MLTRRDFLAASAAAAGTAALPRFARAAAPDDVFKISLAQWSHNRAFRAKGEGKLDPLKFAEISAKDYGISAIEYVNQFYASKKKDEQYLKDLKKVAEDNKVTSVLIMCDNEGKLGDVDDKLRATAVDNHKRWAEWAKFLGCHSIRVNAASDWKKGFAETQKLYKEEAPVWLEAVTSLGLAPS